MIIIADTHLSPTKGNIPEFFQMLDTFKKNNEDLVFLGDIFDLWIALPRYEAIFIENSSPGAGSKGIHRIIGFIEGNHEFFVAEERKKSFSWCSNASEWRDENGILFAHGDRINRKDRNYLFFRKLSKNKITKILIRHLPFRAFLGRITQARSKKNESKISRKPTRG
jgi:UDP-2,3-diacylglucosamine pyrophosphatase LpxH